MNKKTKNGLRKIFVTKNFKDSHEILKIICGPTRHKIVHLLKQSPRGLNVTDLAFILKMSLSRVSHQLKILREHRLVSVKGKNRETVYFLTDHKIKDLLK